MLLARLGAHPLWLSCWVIAGLFSAPIGGMGAEPARLEQGTPIERTLAPGEAHTYEVAITAGQYLRIVTEQMGVDVVIRAFAADGALITEVNNPGGGYVSEVLSFLSRAPTSYRLELTPFPGSSSGRYRIRIQELRPERSGDGLRVAAERAEAAADQQYQNPSAERLVQATENYQTALADWRKLGDAAKEGEILYHLGAVHRMRGKIPEALDLFEQALAVERRLGDRAWQATILNQRGLAEVSLSRFSDALSTFDEALALRRALGDEALTGPILNNLGLVQQSLGNIRQARDAYREAREIFHRTGDRRREGIALGNLGGTQRALGEPLAAVDSFTQALAAARETGDRAGEAEWLNGIGAIQQGVGDPQAALENYTAALRIFRDLGDRAKQAAVLGNLGAFNLEAGEPEKAIDLFEQEIELYRQVGDRKGEALSLTDLGRADAQAGRRPEAVERLNQALAIEREIGDRSGEAATLSYLGFAQTSHGSPREAVEPLTRSLMLWHEIGDVVGEGRAQHFLGLAHAAVGDAPAALAAFGEALRLRRSVGDPAGEIATLQEIGRTEMARGNLEAARAALEPALEKVESLRTRISADRLRSSYFASLRDAYELEIDLLMSLHARQPAAGFDAMAFQTAERARARSLLDLLREARVEIRRGADPALLDEERRSRVGLDAKAERLTRVLAGKPTPEQAAEARRELAEAETAYELAEGRLRAALPAYGNLVHPEPVKLADIQALLDGDTVLLEIAPGEKRSFLWKVTPTSLASFELPARAVIEKAAREAYASLSSPNAQEGARRREPLDRLGRLLFGPLAGGLSGKRLAVVAGEALQYVPFAALTLPSGEPVIDRYEVVSLPSAAVLGELRRKAASRPPAPGALAILADPVFGEDDPRVRKAGQASAPAPRRGEEITRGADLERAARDAGTGTFPRLAWTRREAELATAQAGERKVLVALDFQANRETATGPDLARYRVVHFATHGLLDSRHPEISGLVLSLVDEQGRPRDGFLRLPDIYNLDLGAELVVLSGCQTALGREIRGEGLMGMSRGFFYAGASEVLASLWAVRDRATAELMQRFYRAMFQQGLSPAAALRAAQLSMRREPRWRDPYFWAAFNLQGDWRGASPGPAGTR